MIFVARKTEKPSVNYYVHYQMLPNITRIVNLRLEWSKFPLVLMSARVDPLLKKSTLNPDQCKSYCSVSRLHFLSKVIEKVVALRFNSYMHDNYLNEKYLSVFKQFHSTETVLVCVGNGIRHGVNEKKTVLLRWLICQQLLTMLTSTFCWIVCSSDGEFGTLLCLRVIEVRGSDRWTCLQEYVVALRYPSILRSDM